MHTTFKKILVISRPGRRRETLLSFLRTAIDAAAIIPLDQFPAEGLAVSEHIPTLMVVDWTMMDRSLADFAVEIKQENPLSRILLLLPYVTQAAHAGADAVLLEGASIANLQSVIQKMQPLASDC